MCSRRRAHGRPCAGSRLAAGLFLLFASAAGAPGFAADPLGDQARQAKKPSVVDFGMTRCGQCIEQGKVMDRLKVSLGDRLLTRFVHVGKEEELAEAYKVLLIPTIVIFDAGGREVFRNVGLMPYEALTGKLRELKLL